MVGCKHRLGAGAMSANLTQLDGATPEVLDKLFGRGKHAAAA
jgi:hypothetical protein